MDQSQTHPSLLLRIRDADDKGAWQQFVTFYTPLVRSYARRCGVPPQELDDLLQEVLIVVAREIPRFEYDPSRGRFRSWLRTLAHHRILQWRSGRHRTPVPAADSRFLNELSDSGADLEQYWDEQWREHVLATAVERASQHFDTRTFEAFRRFALMGEPANAVAEALGMTVDNDYVCKSRVLGRVRQEAQIYEG